MNLGAFYSLFKVSSEADVEEQEHNCIEKGLLDVYYSGSPTAISMWLSSTISVNHVPAAVNGELAISVLLGAIHC